MDAPELTAPTMKRWTTAAPAAAFAVATLFAIGAELQQVGENRTFAWLVGDFVGGWTFIAAGTVAWLRRPGNRIGPLLLAIGVTWFIGTGGGIGIDWAAHLAQSFQGFYEPLLGLLVLAYPSGVITNRLERLVAGAWLAAQFAWAIAQLVLARPLAWYSCPTCPATVDEYISNRQLLEVIAPISLALATALAVGVLALAIRRVAGAGPAGRRRLAPVILASAALAMGVVAQGGVRLLVDPDIFDDVRIALLYYAVLLLAAVAVLAGLLQERLARTAVADLVIDLRSDAGRSLDRGRLRSALARALRDPSLELYVADRETGGFRASDGEPAAIPATSSRRAVTWIGGEHDRFAAIAHDPSLLDDPGLVAAVTAAVRLEADNQDLAAEVDRQLAELRASRARIVTATDAERRRVERDLHDGAQQRLVALSMELGRLRAAATQSGDAGMAQAIGGLSLELEATIEELRELARGILPPILTDAGLGAAVESLALRAPLPVDAQVDLPGRLPRAIESTLYFVIAEAMANVARHSKAMRATIRVARHGDTVRATIQDDGVGGAAADRGTGIQGLSDRVGALGGLLRVESVIGGGTRLTAELPVSDA